MLDTWFFRIFGGALVALGFWLFIGGDFAMPTRTPPRAFHFSGASLWLLAAAPTLVGVVFLRIAEQPESRNAPLIRLLIGVGMAALGLAFVLSKVY